jgi:hypothetical protein
MEKKTINKVNLVLGLLNIVGALFIYFLMINKYAILPTNLVILGSLGVIGCYTIGISLIEDITKNDNEI